ncbi:hypothetical protein [Nocardioides houyundeii]|uniref:hypothetical protein n=1 Tax=Nocardioides houyundeii TaxID=2045452 RepID=UPI000DF3E651|nr:hypothetical protein [Nocardioides houyundeii]
MRTRAARAIAALATAALFGAVGAVPASAEPSALYPVTSGSLGNFTYDLQYGPGVTDDGKPALCSRTTMHNVTLSFEPLSTTSCHATGGRKLVAKRRVLDLYGFSSGTGEGLFLSGDTFATAPKVQRLVLKAPGTKRKTLPRSKSTVLSIDGEKVRFFYSVELATDSEYATKVLGQRKVCKKVKLKNGKVKRSCGWKTVADKRVFLKS